MPNILLVNPRKRKTARRKKTVKKRRSAKQKAATRKLVAFNKRRKNPVTRKRRRARKSVSTKRRRPAARRAPARRRRRNPTRRPFTAAKIQRQLTTAAQGAAGAIGLDIALAYIPLPPQMQGPLIGPVIKGLGAIALGVVANMAGVRADTANRMAEGALTVQLHGMGKTMLSQFMPGVPLSEYINDNGLGYAGSGLTAGYMGQDPAGMGIYLPEIQNMDMGMEQTGLGMYENDYNSEGDYIENMSYT